jgi:hypothetical protein
VIEDLFTSELDEEAVLQKHKVSQALYNRWLADDHFVEQVERRIAQAYHFGRITLARCAPVAAGKMVTLTHSKNEETARKACLDIISLDTPLSGGPGPTTDDGKPDNSVLPPEVASRILAALACGNSDQQDLKHRS